MNGKKKKKTAVLGRIPNVNTTPSARSQTVTTLMILPLLPGLNIQIQKSSSKSTRENRLAQTFNF